MQNCLKYSASVILSLLSLYIEVPSNVEYAEVTIPYDTLPQHLWRLLPNVYYSGTLLGEEQ